MKHGNRLYKATTADKLRFQSQINIYLSQYDFTDANEYFLHQLLTHANQSAANYLRLKEFNLFGHAIYLPRKFNSVEDFRKLGSALIIQKNNLVDEQLIGTFFKTHSRKVCAKAWSSVTWRK